MDDGCHFASCYFVEGEVGQRESHAERAERVELAETCPVDMHSAEVEAENVGVEAEAVHGEEGAVEV